MIQYDFILIKGATVSLLVVNSLIRMKLLFQLKNTDFIGGGIG